MSSGKGMIPYQMITDFDSLKKVPRKDFYSELKEKDISDEEYENVKKKKNYVIETEDLR